MKTIGIPQILKESEFDALITSIRELGDGKCLVLETADEFYHTKKIFYKLKDLRLTIKNSGGQILLFKDEDIETCEHCGKKANGRRPSGWYPYCESKLPRRVCDRTWKQAWYCPDCKNQTSY